MKVKVIGKKTLNLQTQAVNRLNFIKYSVRIKTLFLTILPFMRVRAVLKSVYHLTFGKTSELIVIILWSLTKRENSQIIQVFDCYV